MRHVITLIAPTEDADAVAAVMARHGRAAAASRTRRCARCYARPINNTATRGHCDCGAVLAPRHDTVDSFEEKLAKDAARMRWKGRSEANVARAIDDHCRALALGPAVTSSRD
ncbi:hypothetical protein ACO2Q3_18265 [Caulobacter sp. KR2-114]|uniref:hypothetical protein n=1 Tax=Caulobacter sp. KR2-114 TaxID=3400912 RepID=UPI003C068E4A